MFDFSSDFYIVGYPQLKQLNLTGTKEILHGINGRFPSKQLIAIMGPSGAGKSTLLDVLSGYRLTGIQGLVYVNGRIRNLDQFRRFVIRNNLAIKSYPAVITIFRLQ